MASMGGYATGIAKGVAPKERLTVYKVCWKDSDCFDSDILSAFRRHNLIHYLYSKTEFPVLELYVKEASTL
jgi:hypothetical protein